MRKPTHPTVYLRLLAGAVLPAFRDAATLGRALDGRPRPGWRELLLPRADDLQSEAVARGHTGLGFGMALRGAAILAARDSVAQAVLASAPDGVARFQIPEIGFDRWLELTAGGLRGGRGTPPGAADVTVCFPRYRTALAALRQELDTMAAIGAGELVVTGVIPLADRLNVVLERMADYFPIPKAGPPPPHPARQPGRAQPERAAPVAPSK